MTDLSPNGATPTRDTLARRFADFDTLGDALDYAASGVRGMNFHDARGTLTRAYPYRELVEAGGLMSYGPNYAEMHASAASYVDKIFKGAKPADLPIEQPIKFELVINLRAAKALGIEVSPTLLATADEIME